MQNHAIYHPIASKFTNVLPGGVTSIRKVANDELMLQLIGTTLLFDNNVQPANAIEKRVDQLRQRIHRSQQYRLSAKHIVKIYLEAAEIMLDCQRYKDSRDICYTLIQCLANRTANENAELILQLEILTWLQLVKIDRIEKNYCDAFQKIKLINARCDTTQLLEVTLETIKLMFATMQFASVIEMLENRINKHFTTNQIVLAEALAISYTMQHNKQKAQQIFNQITAPITAFDKMILDWRKFEISPHSTQSMSAHLMVNCHALHELLKMRSLSYKHLYFALHLAQWLHAFGDHLHACRLLYAVLEHADYIADEKLKTHSLVRLYSWIHEVDARQIVEDMLIHHFHHTHYFIEQQLMLATYHELKFVEVKKSPYSLDLLLDDLVINVHLFN